MIPYTRYSIYSFYGTTKMFEFFIFGFMILFLWTSISRKNTNSRYSYVYNKRVFKISPYLNLFLLVAIDFIPFMNTKSQSNTLLQKSQVPMQEKVERLLVLFLELYISF